MKYIKLYEELTRDEFKNEFDRFMEIYQKYMNEGYTKESINTLMNRMKFPNVFEYEFSLSYFLYDSHYLYKWKYYDDKYLNNSIKNMMKRYIKKLILKKYNESYHNVDLLKDWFTNYGDDWINDHIALHKYILSIFQSSIKKDIPENYIKTKNYNI